MALKFEKICLKRGFDVRIIPVPREISTSCGFACRYPCHLRDAVMETALGSKIEVASYHELEDV
jgi:hypothetical protein